MATPPEQPSRPSYGYTPGTTLDFARLPIPGNAEFLLYVIVLVVISAWSRSSTTTYSAEWFDLGRTWVTAALPDLARDRQGEPSSRAVGAQVPLAGRWPVRAPRRG